LFANQSGENLGAFGDEALKALAAAIGLDEGDFNNCLDSSQHIDLIEDEFFEAQDRGIGTTPTIVINGEAFEGSLPYEQFQAIIQAELN